MALQRIFSAEVFTQNVSLKMFFIKGALRSFGEDVLIRIDGSLLTDSVCLNRLSLFYMSE